MASIAVSEANGVRYLHLGSDLVQGAMRIARPWSLELEYTREMMMPLMLRAERWPASVLQIGLGSASITRFLHRNRPKARITIVETLPEVVDAARRYFKLPDESRRLRVEMGDGSDYVAAKDTSFDLIVVDGFDGEGRAGLLDTTPFFLNCRARLADGGMVSINLIERNRGVKASIERIRKAFDGHALVLPRFQGGNTIVIAAREAPMPQRPGELRAAAAKLKDATGLDLAPTLQRLEAAPTQA